MSISPRSHGSFSGPSVLQMESSSRSHSGWNRQHYSPPDGRDQFLFTQAVVSRDHSVTSGQEHHSSYSPCVRCRQCQYRSSVPSADRLSASAGEVSGVVTRLWSCQLPLSSVGDPLSRSFSQLLLIQRFLCSAVEFQNRRPAWVMSCRPTGQRDYSTCTHWFLCYTWPFTRWEERKQLPLSFFLGGQRGVGSR